MNSWLAMELTSRFCESYGRSTWKRLKPAPCRLAKRIVIEVRLGSKKWTTQESLIPRLSRAPRPVHRDDKLS
jgi:hypothetical protein